MRAMIMRLLDQWEADAASDDVDAIGVLGDDVMTSVIDVYFFFFLFLFISLLLLSRRKVLGNIMLKKDFNDLQGTFASTIEIWTGTTDVGQLNVWGRPNLVSNSTTNVD